MPLLSLEATAFAGPNRWYWRLTDDQGNLISGHGLEARLILEKEDGSPDEIKAGEFLELVRPAGGRLKWITLSSCLSAAATAEERLRWLGLDPRRHTGNEGEGVGVAEADQEMETGRRMPVLAHVPAEVLDCAVLAMRFPVGDEFAIRLGETLYRGSSSSTSRCTGRCNWACPNCWTSQGGRRVREGTRRCRWLRRRYSPGRVWI